MIWKSPAHTVEEVEKEFGITTHNVNWFEGNIGMLADGTLLAPNDNNLVYSLNRDTGQRSTIFPSNEMVWSLPSLNIETGRIYFATTNQILQNVYSYDLAGKAYAKALKRRRAMAVTTSIGPGALNMVTASGLAYVNRLPVLLLPADTFADRSASPLLQELEHPFAGDLTVNDASVSAQNEAELRGLLAGRRVTDLRRRGKYRLVDLDAPEADAWDGGAAAPPEAGPDAAGPEAPAVPAAAAGPKPAGPTTAVIHLRMTGQLVFRPAPGERPARFVWHLDPDTDLHFQDVRRFGRLWAFGPAAEDDFFAARGMGPEPFGPEFTPAYLREALAGRRGPLKSFLLDQRRLAGVGNIYADEALFRARLHPLRAAGSVGPREALRLHAALLETLQAGIDHEGSSIESFIDPAGQRGSFQEILNVYQRTGEPCRVCGTTVARVVVGGRGTHYCPRCQPRRGGMAPGSRRRRGSVVAPRSAKPAGWELPGR